MYACVYVYMMVTLSREIQRRTTPEKRDEREAKRERQTARIGNERGIGESLIAVSRARERV